MCTEGRVAQLERVREAAALVMIESGYPDTPEPYGPRPEDFPDAYAILHAALADCEPKSDGSPEGGSV